MKKIITLFLCLLVLLTGCTNTDSDDGEGQDTPTQTINPLDPIEEEKIILTSGDQEKFELTRIDSKNRSDADSILQLANQAITEANVPALVTGLYSIPAGLAGNYFSFDPIMIKTDNDSVNNDPLFMVALISEETKDLLGTYRESDLTNKDFRQAAIDIYNKKNREIRNKLGLRDEDMVNFDLMELVNLDIYNASSEFKNLYEECCSHYMNVTFAMWDGDYEDTIIKNEMQYALLKQDNIKTMNDLNVYLEEIFTTELSKEILSSITDELYLEVNNQLYFVPIGIGGNFLIQDIKPTAMATRGSTTYLVIECTIAEDMDEDWIPINVHNEEYLFKFVKQDNGYRCNQYVDISFGQFGF